MTADPLIGLLALALLDAAILYAFVVSRRVHERRIRQRIDETRHLAAVLRAGLAAQRAGA
ncbi:MAG TPA: hypothetical protein VF013_00700 [Candidatus Limnocylindria bacterium]